MTQPAPAAAPAARARRARARQAPRPQPPRLVAVAYGTSRVVFEVPDGVTTRAAVETTGTPRYVAVRGRWKPWPGSTPPSWARSWGGSKQLWRVPLADPDAPRPAPTAMVFEVSASTWSRWPSDVRGELRLVGGFTKGPGVMATAALTGDVAERVRNLAASRGLVGLEERAP